MTATATDNVAVAGVDFYYDNNLIDSDASSPYSISFDTSAASNGSHSLKAIAYDTSGNFTASAFVTISVSNTIVVVVVPDTTPPSVIMSALPGDILSGNETLLADANDNVGVSRVDFYYNSNLIGSDTTYPYSINWNTNLVADGVYDLKANAFDTASNGAISFPVSITVDNGITSTPVITAPSGGGGGGGSSSPSVSIPSISNPIQSQSTSTLIQQQQPVFIPTVQRTYNFGNITLKRGVQGEAVKELQIFFNATQNANLVVDGNFGRGTTAMVMKWQRENNAKVDGLVGNQTKQIMNRIVNQGVSTTPTTQTKRYYNMGTKTLERGVQGEAVKELQRYLNDTLNLGLVVDGNFGLGTKAIVMKWQKERGLVADGKVGNVTKGVMNR